jgi:hypothetical protein
MVRVPTVVVAVRGTLRPRCARRYQDERGREQGREPAHCNQATRSGLGILKHRVALALSADLRGEHLGNAPDPSMRL